jgi:hypothetical protein
MSIVIKNMERRMRIINLPHETYCKAAGRCACAKETVTTVVHDPKTGERSMVSRVKRIPSSLTILGLEAREGLPDALLEIPEVKRALRAGRLRIVEQRSESRKVLQAYDHASAASLAKTRKRKRG